MSSQIGSFDLRLAATFLVLSLAAHQLHVRHRRDYLPRASLQDPAASSLMCVLNSRVDSAYIRLFGLDVQSFYLICGSFEQLFNCYIVDTSGMHLARRRKTGRPRGISPSLCLALTLSFYRSKCEQHMLCLACGIGAAATSKYLRFGHLLLRVVLEGLDDARIKFPDTDELAQFSAIIRAEFPRLSGAFAMVDGLKLCIQAPGDQAMQNAYYNGWTSNHYVSSILLFVPDGTVCFAILNAPGSWHDSRVASAGGLYATLAKLPDPYFVVADSAFPISGELEGKIKRVPKKNESSTLDTEQQSNLTSIRQASEWGMRSFQGAFPRL
jgi:hypothetical protein